MQFYTSTVSILAQKYQNKINRRPKDQKFSSSGRPSTDYDPRTDMDGAVRVHFSRGINLVSSQNSKNFRNFFSDLISEPTIGSVYLTMDILI